MKKKRKPISEETKRKISKSVKQYRLGKLHSEATKQKMSLSQKGNKGRLGKPHSNETKDKISNSLRGENHPMYGKHLSLETKVKIGQSGKGREHSNESKLKMSESRKRLYETGWESTCGRCKKIPYDSKKYGVIKVDGSWEFAVAIYLDSINVDWIRNKLRVKYIRPDGKKATYCPDFYVKEWDSYIEVKGYKTALDEAKWKQFPFKLLVWDHSVLLQKGILNK